MVEHNIPFPIDGQRVGTKPIPTATIDKVVEALKTARMNATILGGKPWTDTETYKKEIAEIDELIKELQK